MKAIMMNDVEVVCKNCFLKHFVKCKGWEERHEECPWKPLPEEREPMEDGFDDYSIDEFADGWNACLKEIEK